MTRHQEDPDPQGKKRSEKENTVGSKEKIRKEDSCRCKEVSKKSVPGMFKLMLDDLAFWRKLNKREK